MNEPLVSARNISKKFCRSLKRSLWYGLRDIGTGLNPFASGEGATEVTRSAVTLRRDEFWALQDISFEVRRGECLGLIGHNGAGKSTLLKILNGLIRPDTGEVVMRGRTGALIELNAGFNPILSGRENVYNQASLLGFTHQETQAKFDEIVEFSEIGEFLDMPVQNYSSGMKVRLGFAVAVQMEPDVLLIDEVLAVGDVGFRAKCLARMAELRKKSAFIFVSHSMPQVARISTQVMHLEHGKCAVHTTDLSRGLDSYYRSFATSGQALSGSGDASIAGINATAGTTTVAVGGQLPVELGEDIDFVIDCQFRAGVTDATIQLLIWNQELVPIVDVVGEGFRRVPVSIPPSGKCRVHAKISGLQLNSGRFSVSVIILSPDGAKTLCLLDQAVELRVSSNLGGGSALLFAAAWGAETHDQ